MQISVLFFLTIQPQLIKMSTPSIFKSNQPQEPAYVIKVVPYQENWPCLFEEEAEKIYQILGNECLNIYHIGSTSIPGLAAKPVIDMMPVVQDLFGLGKFCAALAELGYKDRGVCLLTQAHVFLKSSPHCAVNIHAFEVGNDEIDFHLKFRNYLRAHDNARDAYMALKIDLAQKYAHDSLAYCLGKAPFFKAAYAQIDRIQATTKISC